MEHAFDIFLTVMALLALAVFIALHFFEAGYGYLFNRRYGPPIPNKIGWVLMESPVFILMCVLWATSDRMGQAGPLTLFLLFQAHYFQRSFIFPLLIRGNSKMPLGIVLMGMVFNTLNALMQGGWIFWVSRPVCSFTATLKRLTSSLRSSTSNSLSSFTPFSSE